MNSSYQIRENLTRNSSQLYRIFKGMKAVEAEIEKMGEQTRTFFKQAHQRLEREVSGKDIKDMARETSRLRAQVEEEWSRLKLSREEGGEFTKSTLEISTRINQVEITFASVAGEYKELDMRMRFFQSSTRDGKYIWKLDKFWDRLDDAQVGKARELHTPPLYTGVFGYKFAVKICLAGDLDSLAEFKIYEWPDGRIPENYISLYFYLMAGDYDEILKFPLEYPFIRIAILDQSPARRHISKLIEPGDPAPFRKPMGDTNPAVGFPMFVDREHLVSNGHYVVNNVMFLECQVSL